MAAGHYEIVDGALVWIEAKAKVRNEAEPAAKPADAKTPRQPRK